MSPVRYSLHYEDYSEQLMSRFGKLLQQQALVDMTLMCSTHTLRVHKAVLAASSAYFEEVLQKVSGEPLVVLKISFSVLKSLVEFMYCGRTACGHDNLAELLAAARFLGIKGLSRVTREGLGITHHEEIPEFSAPVVINRPAATSGPSRALPQECDEPQPSTSAAGAAPDRSKTDAETCLPMHCVTRRPDVVVRIPLDVAAAGAGGAGGAGGAADAAGGYAEPPRAVRPRRGRPSMRHQRGGAGGAGAAGAAGGAGAPWERRGVMARAAERALLRRERDSRHAIHRLSTLQNSRMQDYLEQVSLSQAVDSICGPEPAADAPGYLGCGAGAAGAGEGGISSAMSQYVKALKSAGLPTDLPIVFETGDGSYVNVDEQVLLDMVQSSEIQYEVVERPISLEAAAQPGQVKSIDDLSRCIEQAGLRTSFPQEDGGGLSAILPDSAEPYSLPEPPEPPPRADRDNPFDGDLFGGGALADHVSKYYEEHFSMSLLQAESGELRKSDCFDFELPLPQGAFKGDALDCLMADAAPPADLADRADRAAPADLADLADTADTADTADDDRFGGMLKFHDKRPARGDVKTEAGEGEAGAGGEPSGEPSGEPDATDAGSEIEKIIDKIKSEKISEGAGAGGGALPSLADVAEGEEGEAEAEGEGATRKRRASEHDEPASDAPTRCLRSKVKKKL